jgi:hypothetical protein
MSSPRTILDAHFSDPGTQATDWSGTREVLEDGTDHRPADVR